MSTERTHPDVFTAEEAAAYLRQDVAALETLRVKYGLAGFRPAGKGYVYHREDLDACVLRMFGRAPHSQQLRLAGGRR